MNVITTFPRNCLCRFGFCCFCEVAVRLNSKNKLCISDEKANNLQNFPITENYHTEGVIVVNGRKRVFTVVMLIFVLCIPFLQKSWNEIIIIIVYQNCRISFFARKLSPSSDFLKAICWRYLPYQPNKGQFAMHMRILLASWSSTDEVIWNNFLFTIGQL